MKYLFNKKGMTLIELMLALALMGVFGLMVVGAQADIYENFFREQESSQFHMNLQTMHQLMRDRLVGMAVSDERDDIEDRFLENGEYYSFYWVDGGENSGENDKLELRKYTDFNDYDENDYDEYETLQTLYFEYGYINEISVNEKDSNMININVKYNEYGDYYNYSEESSSERDYTISVREFNNSNNLEVDDLTNENEEIYFVAIYDLNINIDGDGEVEVEDGEWVIDDEKVIFFAVETEEAELEAYPDSGWEFEGWYGPDGDDVEDEDSADTTINMDSDKEITAVFGIEDFPLIDKLEDYELKFEDEYDDDEFILKDEIWDEFEDELTEKDEIDEKDDLEGKRIILEEIKFEDEVDVDGDMIFGEEDFQWEVGEDLKFEDEVEVKGDLDFGDDWEVGEELKFENEVEIDGDMNFGDDWIVGEDLKFEDEVEVEGDIICGDDWEVGGELNFDALCF